MEPIFLLYVSSLYFADILQSLSKSDSRFLSQFQCWLLVVVWSSSKRAWSHYFQIFVVYGYIVCPFLELPKPFRTHSDSYLTIFINFINHLLQLLSCSTWKETTMRCFMYIFPASFLSLSLSLSLSLKPDIWSVLNTKYSIHKFSLVYWVSSFQRKSARNIVHS